MKTYRLKYLRVLAYDPRKEAFWSLICLITQKSDLQSEELPCAITSLLQMIDLLCPYTLREQLRYLCHDRCENGGDPW